MKLDEQIQFGPVSREQIKDYCDASGDHNRIHWDPSFAKEAGLPDVIAHGMLSMGLVGEALDRWGYSLKNLQGFDTKFKEMVNPGDSLVAICLNPADALSSRIMKISLQKVSGQEVANATVKILP